jgi:hypothetical protein
MRILVPKVDFRPELDERFDLTHEMKAAIVKASQRAPLATQPKFAHDQKNQILSSLFNSMC